MGAGGGRRGEGLARRARRRAPPSSRARRSPRLAVLTLLSTGWAVSDEKAFLEFTRVLMYLGVFAVVAVAVRARHAAAVSDGLALGIVGVVLLALASRFWWGDIGPGAPPLFFPVQTPAALPGELLERARDPGRAGAARCCCARRWPSGPPILRALALAPVPAIAGADLPHLLARRRGGGGPGRAGLPARSPSRRTERAGGDRDRGRRRDRARSRCCLPATPS